MKTGLVLEGGGMRGMYTQGVLDGFLETGISFDGIIGVSAGALIGINFLSKQKGRALRYSKKYNGNKHYMGILPLMKEGNLVSPSFAYEKMSRDLDKFDDETFQKSGTPFYATITNVKTGKAEYKQIQSGFQDVDILRASGSLPFVSTPVRIGEEFYLDGGIADSIPYEAFREMGYEKLVIVLTRELGYQKKPVSKFLVRSVYKKYPNLCDVLEKRHIQYNGTLQKLRLEEREGKIFVLRPSRKIQVGRLEKEEENLQKGYDLGRLDIEERLEVLQSYLSK